MGDAQGDGGRSGKLGCRKKDRVVGARADVSSAAEGIGAGTKAEGCTGVLREKRDVAFFAKSKQVVGEERLRADTVEI